MGQLLRLFMFAITKKCPTQCEHYFESDKLNQPEVLSRENLRTIVRKFQVSGISIIWFSGGEPMMRPEDIIQGWNRPPPPRISG